MREAWNWIGYALCELSFQGHEWIDYDDDDTPHGAIDAALDWLAGQLYRAGCYAYGRADD